MKINDIEAVYYGVEDVNASVKFLNDFGLNQLSFENDCAEFETTDGSKVFVWPESDPRLPKNWTGKAGSTLRMVRWRADDQQTIDEIAENLGKDREVRIEDGILYSHDDTGMGLAFIIAKKPTPSGPVPASNMTGVYQRPVNTRAFETRDPKVKPRNIGHVVLECDDYEKAINFYIERLGFLLSDTFTDLGKFLRAEGAREHHTLFFINRPPNALNHVAFYVMDLEEVIVGGKQLIENGWETRWGPGRHVLGSNHFWYFESPLGGGVEYACDPDYVDENWVPKELPAGIENSATWTITDFV
jgi:catechol 2,3-dioxygenase-like lactoylglutathione lyase family enzyme